MSSILIKGMEMPLNCAECPIADIGAEFFYCEKIELKAETRPCDCPLLEVSTPHGDLVDRDELLAEYDRRHKGPAGGARRIMEQAKTVIKAEGE